MLILSVVKNIFKWTQQQSGLSVTSQFLKRISFFFKSKWTVPFAFFKGFEHYAHCFSFFKWLLLLLLLSIVASESNLNSFGIGFKAHACCYFQEFGHIWHHFCRSFLQVLSTRRWISGRPSRWFWVISKKRNLFVRWYQYFGNSDYKRGGIWWPIDWGKWTRSDVPVYQNCRSRFYLTASVFCNSSFGIANFSAFENYQLQRHTTHLTY